MFKVIIIFKENQNEKMEPTIIDPFINELDCACCDESGVVDQLCINPFADDDVDKEMVMDDDMMGKGMRMGGAHMLMGMFLMETIGSGLMTFRWTAADKFDTWEDAWGVNWWSWANMVCNYGNFTASVSGLLLMIATMIVEDSGMMAMGIGMTIKMGMAVYGISSLLRLMAYDVANT